jgi:hypothetical protein
MPRIGRPRLTPRQRACAIGVTLVVLAILVTAVVAPVNGDWWWARRAAFILALAFWCSLLGGVLWLGRRRRAVKPALRGGRVRAARAVIAVITLIFAVGTITVLGVTVRSVASGPQSVDVSQCLGLERRGSRSGWEARLITEAGERLDVEVSGILSSDVDDRLRRACDTHEPFTIHWYPPMGPVLKIREG